MGAVVRIGVLVGLSLSTLAYAADSPATIATARLHFRKGMAQYVRFYHYDEAIVEFEAGFAADPATCVSLQPRTIPRQSRAQREGDRVLSQVPRYGGADAGRGHGARGDRSAGARAAPAAVTRGAAEDRQERDACADRQELRRRDARAVPP